MLYLCSQSIPELWIKISVLFNFQDFQNFHVRIKKKTSLKSFGASLFNENNLRSTRKMKLLCNVSDPSQFLHSSICPGMRFDVNLKVFAVNDQLLCSHVGVFPAC